MKLDSSVIAVVTGGASGLGEATTRALAEKGVKVSIFDFNEDDFIEGCEEAIKRVKSNPVNEEGKKLQTKFSYENTVDELLKLI